MKPNIHLIFFYFLIGFCVMSIVSTLNLKFKAKDDDEGKDPERIPGININIEHNDLDPANTRRFDSERKTSMDRIREMEYKIDSEKRFLEKVVAAQVAKIAEVSQIAMTTYNILDSVSSKKYNAPEFYFGNK